MEELVLGKIAEYAQTYDPTLLQGVPRSMSREQLNIRDPLPFSGTDIWNGYELSWLNPKGKPEVAVLRCMVPISSQYLIESKSFKLYLNSFNQTKISDKKALMQTLEQDLSKCAGKKVEVEVLDLAEFKNMPIGDFDGELLDTLDISVDCYDIQADSLTCKDNYVSETLVSHLLKSNCLITNQPDWGSILIKYSGKQIEKESLLKYIISFRQHNEFHEQCVERIFTDIMRACRPEKLTVYARYTRRGGLDINPFRSNFEKPYSDVRLARQ